MCPKMCACPYEDDPSNPDIMQCECCKHQQEYTGWQKTYCEPCIFSQFPNRYSALYYLYNKCQDIRVLGGGMAGVPDVFINPSWLEYYLDKIGRVPTEWQESIVDQLETIENLGKQFEKIEVPFGEDEIIELRSLNAKPKQP